MSDVVERQEAEKRHWVGVVQYLNRSLDELASALKDRDNTIATLTRRVEELGGGWRPITDHPDQPCDVMFYRAEAEWISGKTLDVMPGMPDRERFDIGYWEDNAWHYACSNHEVFEFGGQPGDNLQDPTHWMFLPTPPRGENHG